MAEEKKKSPLFREKNIEAINSPEKLDQYLKVTSPGVWAFFAAVIVVLIGLCIWGIFGKLETNSVAAVVCEDGECICLVPQDALSAVINDPHVTVDGKEYTLAPDVLTPTVISEETNVYILLGGNLKAGDVVYEIPVAESMADGIYSGTITTETISPMSLLFN